MTAQASAVNVTGDAAVSAVPCTYRGFFIASAAGATVTIYDHASAASGTVLASFTLAAGGSLSDDIADGVRCLNGVYVDTSAAVTGHVRIG
ncbi:hypothetical protein [Actinomadura sp. HBU206391]|uniref:hypothetical protein n=1 Tax=Actinomadura sp. HBU206391 TaxID=2731692 RepID=UPI00164EFE03|nr:hypothetical protein [Actinomadura sp. HBU206391]MBC6458419.1 hypothetical protein [Actinomadura sp. HBU206391]